MDSWLLYRHTSPSGKVYIGITSTTPEKRWANGYGYKSCVLFYRAIQKYGWNNIKHEVLFSGLSEEKAKSLEIKTISHYKNLGISYNITDGGDGALGRHPSSETRKILREKKLGKPLSEEHKAKIRKSTEKLKGIPRTDEVKRKLHEANKGKKPSPQTMLALAEYNKNRPPISAETRNKMSEANRKRDHTKQIELLNKNREEIGIKHRKPVIQFDLDGRFIAMYPAVKFASEALHIDVSTIISCCKHKQNKTGEFLWMYKEDYDKHISSNTLDSVLLQMVIKAKSKGGQYIRTEEHRKMRSLAQAGKDVRTEEQKVYMIACAKEACSKPIAQLSMSGSIINVFYNGTEAAKTLGYTKNMISRCCTGKKKNIDGYLFQFITKEDYEIYKQKLAT